MIGATPRYAPSPPHTQPRTRARLDLGRAELERLGYPNVLASDPPGTRPDRRLGVLVAAREPLEEAPSPALPWPERHLAAVVGGAFELHDLHAPISSKAEQVKVRTLEAMHAHLAA